ncbi:tetratricopeptide repeat protein [Amycolatopsis tolypomycina]|nr:tetratricopeptide repeat protein [Amycolatopsis tolypomycina]
MSKFRVRLGVSLRELEDRTGIAKSTIADALNPDRRFPNDDAVSAIVAALCQDPGYHETWMRRWWYLRGLHGAENTVTVKQSLPDKSELFVGRGAVIRRMLQSVSPDGRTAAACFALTGLAGMGKTTLAIHVAHEMYRRRTFDKVLFVNLRAVDNDPSLHAVAPNAVLEQFLRSLGVSPSKIPHDLNSKTARFRGLSRSTRLLILLDNAKDADQVKPLIADGPGCVTLITSRNRLSSLNDAVRLNIAGLRRDEAIQLLRSVQPFGDTDTSTLRQIAALLHDVPMSLAAFLVHVEGHTDWSATEHLDRLKTLLPNAAAASRDPGSAVGPAEVEAAILTQLALSYQTLSSPAQTLVCLTGLHPGHDFDDATAAALTGQPAEHARSALNELAEAHFLTAPVPGRHEPHDIVRGFAARRAIDDVSPTARRQAMQRVMTHYLNSAATALSTSGQQPSTEGVPDHDVAAAWVQTELANIVRLVRSCGASDDLHCSAHDLAAIVVPHLLQQARYRDVATLLSASLPAYADCAHTDQHAQSLNQLGQAQRRLGKTDLAISLHMRALRFYTTTRNVTGQVATLNKLGLTYRAQGRVEDAQQQHSRAAELASELGAGRETLSAFGNLGVTHDLLGDLDQALACYHEVLRLAAELDDPRSMAKARSDIGIIHVRRGHIADAIDEYRSALDILRLHPDRLAETVVLENLGIAHTKAGDPATGLTLLSRALTLREESGYVLGEAHTHHDLGLTYLALGDVEQALTHMRRVHELAASVGSTVELAFAENSLGEIAFATARFPDATTHFARALDHALTAQCLDEQARAHFGLARIPRREPTDVHADLVAGRSLIATMGVPEPPTPRVGTST